MTDWKTKDCVLFMTDTRRPCDGAGRSATQRANAAQHENGTPRENAAHRENDPQREIIRR
jgi:hypothetical protein